MPICIECCYPVSELYHVLRSHKSAAPTPKPSIPNLSNSTTTTSPKLGTTSPKAPETTATRFKKSTGGADVRLTQCPRCKRFADKYVEHDYVVLFIDLVLVKPQVYRHLLFNRLAHSSSSSDEFDPSILRLGTLLLLFDVYLTWSHIENLPQHLTSKSPIGPHRSILLQYAFYLFFCGVSTLSQHLVIRWLACFWRLGDDDDDSKGGEEVENEDGSGGAGGPLPAAPPRKPTPNSISTALFVSSCMSLFPILMVVWKYDDSTSTSTSPSAPQSSPSSATSAQPHSNNTNKTFMSGFLSSQGRGVDWVRRGVSWAVAVQNIEALRILLGCGYLGAAGLVGVGGMVRWVVRSVVLGVVGLGEAG